MLNKLLVVFRQSGGGVVGWRAERFTIQNCEPGSQFCEPGSQFSERGSQFCEPGSQNT